MTRNRKIATWTACIVASPFALFLLLALLLYVPPVQDWAVRTAARIASRQTGWEISLQRVRLRFPLDLDLQQLSVTTPDTLLAVNSLTLNTDLSQLLKLRVGVKGIDLAQGTLDTQDLIASLRVKALIGSLHLSSDCIDLRSQTVDLTQASLSQSDIDLALQDTTVVDTTEASPPPAWVINIADVRVTDTRLAFHMPGDTMSVAGFVSSLTLAQGKADLGEGVYEAETARLQANALAYNLNYEPYVTGVDFNHLLLSDIALSLDDVRYTPDSLTLFLSQCQATEKSGLTLSQMQTHFLMTAQGISLPDALIATPSTTVALTASLDFDALTPGKGGRLSATVDASAGKQDLALFAPDVAPLLPDAPIELAAKASGNIDRLALTQLSLSIAPMLRATATANACNLLDAQRLSADVDLEVNTYDLSPLNELAGLGDAVAFPRMNLTGQASLEGSQCSADLTLSEGAGAVAVNAAYDLNAQTCNARLAIRDLHVSDFLPSDSLIALTASVKAAGAGTDIFDTATRIAASLRLDSLAYNGLRLANIDLTAKLAQGKGSLSLNADNDIVKAQATLTANIGKAITVEQEFAPLPPDSSPPLLLSLSSSLRPLRPRLSDPYGIASVTTPPSLWPHLDIDATTSRLRLNDFEASPRPLPVASGRDHPLLALAPEGKPRRGQAVTSSDAPSPLAFAFEGHERHGQTLEGGATLPLSLAGNALPTHRQLALTLANDSAEQSAPVRDDAPQLPAATARKPSKGITATLDVRLDSLDLRALGLASKPLNVASSLRLNAQSDLAETHSLAGRLGDIELSARDTTFRPRGLTFACGMAPDTLYATAESGDLALRLTSHEGLDSLLARVASLGEEIGRQVSEYEIDELALKDRLPSLALSLSCGTANPVHNMLYALSGYRFDSLTLDMESGRANGLWAEGQVLELNTGAMLVDTVSLDMFQDLAGALNLNAHVANNTRNRQAVFSTDLNTTLTGKGIGTMLTFNDDKGRKGLELGLALDIADHSLRLRLRPLNPTVAYRSFALNEGNYISLDKEKRVRADVDLLSDDGTGLRIVSTENSEALNDLTLSLEHVDIGEITALLPYMPDVRGLFDGDVHVVQTGEQLSVSVEANIEGLVYEDTPMGDVGANLLYLPNADGTQFVDGAVTYDGEEVLLLNGTYDPSGEGTIKAEATMQRMPLALANGFIPDKMAGLDGYVEASLTVEGSLASPSINGTVSTDSMRIYSDMYSLNLRFPDDTLSIKDNYISLNRIEAYSTGSSPLVLDGDIDCRDLSNIGLNLSVQASNFELINAPKTRQAVAYGKVYVNMLTKVTGTLNDLSLKGALTLLGNTDVTYVLTDSPLSANDQLAELVEFADFTEPEDMDSLPSAKPQNIEMQMYVSIEQTAQVHCLLSADGGNYIELEGGGDFTLGYNGVDGLSLYGRYTVISGVMNYSIMVLSLKDCNIESGSYVEFMGNVLNPRLNLTATERVKSTVTEDNVPRTVAFDVGVTLSQTLENLGLEFNIDAPEDMTVSNQLATLTAEGRSKTAVTLLVTGMYIAEDGSTSGFNGSNALNAFLQSQISSISNKALSSVDINFDMENSTTATGGSQTDYNFSFAKHFWGNRISLIIGGKVSSGDDVDNNGQSIIDNVSIEYRLDRSATRYVRVYYDKSTESIMEGEITEMGAGIVLRRKSNRLGELFLFKKSSKL